MPCVTQDRAGWTQRAAWFKGNFTFPLLDVDPVWKIPRSPRSQAFQGHWNTAFLKRHGLSHYGNASSADGVSRAERRVESHPRVTARDCKASQDRAVPECTMLELPASILSRAQVFLGYAWAQVLSSALWKLTKQTNCCRQRSRFKESALQLCQQTLREPEIRDQAAAAV